MVAYAVLVILVLVIAGFAGKGFWDDRRWHRLSESLQMSASAECRTEEMRIAPILGEMDGQEITIAQFVVEGTIVTSVSVTLPRFLNVGLIAEAEAWDAKAARVLHTVSSLENMARGAYRRATAKPAQIPSLSPNNRKLNDTYKLWAEEKTIGNRIINSPSVTEAFLNARGKGWAVYADDEIVEIIPGTGAVTSPNAIRQAIRLASELGIELSAAVAKKRKRPKQRG